MSTETRLKPCPFCGGAAKEFERFNANVITCRRCGAKVRQSEMGEGDAAVRWNQRATPVAAQHAATLANIEAFVACDASAVSYLSLGEYRTALLRMLRQAPAEKEPGA